jgi:hypothetical protein
MAQIILSGDGVTIELEDEIARSDELLKRALSPHYPDVANALISRQEKDNLLKVTISKRAGSKGNMNAAEFKHNQTSQSQHPVVMALAEAPDYLNPALALAWQLFSYQPQQGAGNHPASPSPSGSGEAGLRLENQLALQAVIRESIVAGETEAAQVHKTVELLNSAPPVPSRHVPKGF